MSPGAKPTRSVGATATASNANAWIFTIRAHKDFLP